MRAINCSAYGEADVLKVVEMINPVPAGNQILIKVVASSVSTVDVAFRKGEPFMSRIFSGLSKPTNPVPGDIVAGVIESVGSEVKLFKVGQRVFGHAGTNCGAHAEYLVLNDDEAILEMPIKMSFEDAVAISYSAMTALPFIRGFRPDKAEPHYLINGASGAIGTFGIQLAKHYGARVTAVCGPNNQEMVKLIGADESVDYTQQKYNAIGQTYDVVFDSVGKSSYQESKPCLTDNGVYLSTMPDIGLMLRSVFGGGIGHKKGKFLATGLRKNPEKIKDLEILIELYNQGEIKPVIDKTYAMEEIAAAHRHVETGHANGTVVLTLCQVE